MSYNTNPPKVEYQAGANTRDFPFLFKIFFDTDMRVFHTNSAGVTTELALGPDYYVTINGDDGGVVTIAELAVEGDYYVLQRELDLNRYVEYQTSGDLLAVTLNADQDYQTYLISDQNSLKDNSLHLPEGTFGVNTEIPAPVADNFFKWNSTGTAVEYGASSNLIVAWGNINGTLSDQTDLQSALNAKADNTSTNWIATNNGTWTGTVVGENITADKANVLSTINLFDLFTMAEGQTDGDIFMYQNNNIAIQPLSIQKLSNQLELTPTYLTWDEKNVVVEDAYATDTTGGTIKILVSGADCYITTDGSTPGP